MIKKKKRQTFCLGNDLKKLATKSSQQAHFCAPKFPLVLKSLTSRTALRKQQAHQTTVTMMAGGLQQEPRDGPKRWNKNPNVLEDSRVSLGTWLEPVKPREREQQVFGEGRLAAQGHTPVCLSKAPFKISLFKDPTSSSADCADAGLFLSHVVGPLVFFTEHPCLAFKTIWKRSGTPSSHVPTPIPTPTLGNVYVGHAAAAAVGVCVCVSIQTILEFTRWVPWVCEWVWPLKVGGRSPCIQTHCVYKLTNSQTGHQVAGTLLPLQHPCVGEGEHLWVSYQVGDDQGRTLARQPQGKNESMGF